jgi:hypothetical protein
MDSVEGEWKGTLRFMPSTLFQLRAKRRLFLEASRNVVVGCGAWLVCTL